MDLKPEIELGVKGSLDATLRACFDIILETDGLGGELSVWSKKPEWFNPERLPRYLNQLFPADQSAILHEVLEEIQLQNESYPRQVQLSCENGMSWFEIVGAPHLAKKEKTSRYLILLRDISMLKETDHRLHQSNQLLDSIIEHIPNMIFLKRATDLRFERFNRAGEALLGFDRSQLIGRNDYDFFPQDQAEFFVQKDREVLSQDSIVDIPEEKIDTPHGTRILHTQKLTLRDARGNPSYLLGISEDITSRKQAEMGLLRQSQLQRTITEVASVIVNASSPNLKEAITKALEISSIFLGVERATLYTYSENASTAMRISEWYAPEIAIPEHRARFIPLSKMVWCFEQFHKHGMLVISNVDQLPPDATIERSYLISEGIQSLVAFPVRQKGHLAGFFSFATMTCTQNFTADEMFPVQVLGDILGGALSRHQAELALLRERARLSQALELARLGNWELDFLENRFEASPQLLQIFDLGETVQSPTFADLFNTIHPEDRATIEEQLCMGKNEVTHRIISPDGQVRFVHHMMDVALDPEGKPLRRYGTVQDITHIKLAEQALVKARQGAERANLAKSEFLSRMSHELRTPLNAIMGFSQLMALDHNITNEQHEGLEEVQKAGKHLLFLINEVLDLSKIEAGRIELSLEPVDVGDVLRECLSLMMPLAKKQSLSLTHAELDGFAVKADHTRLKQIILNLLSNALKYNRPQGKVWLVVEALTEKTVRITVADTGQGIETKSLENLFEPFNRMGFENSGIEGTGVGLSITRNLVHLMDGEIGVSSELGVGSQFWVEFPRDYSMEEGDETHAKASPEYQPGEPHEDASGLKQKTVLYIEDNPVNLKLVGHILAKQLGINLLTANDPRLGLELAAVHLPDLILLDISMPNMDGYQVLQALRLQQELATIPVVALTANAMPEDIERGRAAGFDGYLTKPFRLEEFLRTINNLLSREDA